MGQKSQLLIVFLLFFVNALDGFSLHAQDVKSQTTIILSLDGFRWDYPDKTSTPALDRIAREGVKAIALIPSFPSKTFPNHYTIATGLVPDHHGLVNNAFYDSKMGKSFSINNKEARTNPAFYGGEPIWITAQNQGVKTASFYWVGSDVAIMGQHPDIWKDYNEDVPLIQRIDTIIKWLGLPLAERPRLIMAYYHEPDGVGHEYGPDDARTLVTVRKIDSLIGFFYKRIKQLPDGDSINLLIVADHGMGNITSNRNIVLRDYIPETWPVRIEGGTPNFNLYADGAWVDSAFEALSRAPHLKVWKPSEVPGYLNYGTNPRVGNIIVVADSAWSVSVQKPQKTFSGGTHGYDIRNTDMHAIFYAVGPAFKQNFLHPAFQNIHIYPLLAYLLGIEPAHTDGELKQVINMLKPIK
jgi:predicted AlkP superfamily pyrophosphatase or phosphodiesterase